MGVLLFIIGGGIPLTLAYLLYRLALLGPVAKGLAVLLSVALGIFVVLVGYNLGFIGFEDVKAGRAVRTSYPVLGVIWIVVGGGIALFGSIACAFARRGR